MNDSRSVAWITNAAEKKLLAEWERVKIRIDIADEKGHDHKKRQWEYALSNIESELYFRTTGKLLKAELAKRPLKEA